MTHALSYATPRVGVSPRCLLIGAPLTAALWAMIITALVAPAAPICCTPAKDVRHG